MLSFTVDKWGLPLLFLGAQNVYGRELVPIRPGGGRGNTKRQDASGMDLRNMESFLWGEAGQYVNCIGRQD